MLGFSANTTIFTTEYKTVKSDNESDNKNDKKQTVHHIKIYCRPVISCVNAQFYARLRVAIWCEAIRNYDYTYLDPEWITASDLTENHFVCVPINKKAVPLTSDLLTHTTQIPEDIQDAPLEVVDEFLNYLDVKRYSDNRFIVLGLERLYLKRGLMKDVVYPPNFFIDCNGDCNGDRNGWFKVISVTNGEGICSDCKEAKLVENVLVRHFFITK
jgi:hypothetical protein